MRWIYYHTAICFLLICYYSCKRKLPGANAGEDRVILDTNACQLNATSPSKGQGKWYILKGTGGKIKDNKDPQTPFTGRMGEKYLLSWKVTVSYGYSNDLVYITFQHSEEALKPNAGKDTIVTDTNMLNLYAGKPINGTGEWRIISGTGGHFANPSSPESLFRGEINNSYQLEWSITDQDTTRQDTIEIHFTYSIDSRMADAGKDTIIYDTNQLNLYANKPVTGTGKWKILSGNGGTINSSTQYNSLFSGEMDETYTLEWTIEEPDTTWSDQVIIEIKTGMNPSQANAGEDQYHYNITTTTLEGNLPQNGQGQWIILSGSGGSLTNPHANDTEFTGQAEESYQLEWRIFTSSDTTRDTVTIHFLSFQCGDTIKDPRDGQKYSTVLIGSQCWFAENLNVGEQINASMGQSNNGTIEKWCYNDMSSNCDQYGGLYQWNEMMNYTTTESSQGICPKGWHVPSDEEYQALEIHLGMSPEDAAKNNTWRGSPVGTALKTGGSSGYNALLSGGHMGSWEFFNKDSYEYPWTSTESGSNAFRRCIRSSSSEVGRYDSYPKSSGLSVRCIKNN